MMKGKIIVVVLMLIFALAILPAHATITQESEPPQPANDDIEWWPMFHHDVQLTGFTPAESPDTNTLDQPNRKRRLVQLTSHRPRRPAHRYRGTLRKTP